MANGNGNAIVVGRRCGVVVMEFCIYNISSPVNDDVHNDDHYNIRLSANFLITSSFRHVVVSFILSRRIDISFPAKSHRSFLPPRGTLLAGCGFVIRYEYHIYDRTVRYIIISYRTPAYSYLFSSLFLNS